MKIREIKKLLRMIDEHLANAEKYVARNVNVESSCWLHTEDWNGKSGHPLWMKNHMVPTTEKHRAKLEKTLERIMARKRERARESARKRQDS